MSTDTQNISPKPSQDPAPPRPYLKPAVERIPLSEARGGLNLIPGIRDLVLTPIS